MTSKPSTYYVSDVIDTKLADKTSSNLTAGNVTPNEYDYDYKETSGIGSIPVAELTTVGVVYGVMLLLGVVGNSLVVVSIAKHRRMQTVTNAFLASLASADLLLVLTCIPIKFIKFFTFSWTFGEVMCKLVHYLQNVSVICSVLTMTCMSIERYYAIIHPLQVRFRCNSRRARKVIGFVWLASFSLAIPIIFGQVLTLVGDRFKAFWCEKRWPTATHAIIYELTYAAVVFVVPLGIMTAAYASICRELWTVSALRTAMHPKQSYEMGPHESSEETNFRVVANHRTSPGSVTGRMTSRSVSEGRRVETSFKTYRIIVNETPSRKSLATNDDRRKRQQVIKMLVIIIVLFVICWGPTLVDNVLVAFNIVDKLHYGFLKHLRQAFAIMAYSNSCVNPIIYAFMSKNFRQCFRQALFGGAHCSLGGAPTVGVDQGVRWEARGGGGTKAIHSGGETGTFRKGSCPRAPPVDNKSKVFVCCGRIGRSPSCGGSPVMMAGILPNGYGLRGNGDDCCRLHESCRLQRYCCNQMDGCRLVSRH